MPKWVRSSLIIVALVSCAEHGEGRARRASGRHKQMAPLDLVALTTRYFEVWNAHDKAAIQVHSIQQTRSPSSAFIAYN